MDMLRVIIFMISDIRAGDTAQLLPLLHTDLLEQTKTESIFSTDIARRWIFIALLQIFRVQPS